MTNSASTPARSTPAATPDLDAIATQTQAAALRTLEPPALTALQRDLRAMKEAASDEAMRKVLAKAVQRVAAEKRRRKAAPQEAAPEAAKPEAAKPVAEAAGPLDRAGQASASGLIRPRQGREEAHQGGRAGREGAREGAGKGRASGRPQGRETGGAQGRERGRPRCCQARRGESGSQGRGQAREQARQSQGQEG